MLDLELFGFEDGVFVPRIFGIESGVGLLPFEEKGALWARDDDGVAETIAVAALVGEDEAAGVGQEWSEGFQGVDVCVEVDAAFAEEDGQADYV